MKRYVQVREPNGHLTLCDANLYSEDGTPEEMCNLGCTEKTDEQLGIGRGRTER